MFMTTKLKDTTGPTMRISQAAREAGVGTSTLEYYILLGLVRPRRRKDRGGRFFDEILIKRIRLIHQLNQSGYTLRDIREIYLAPHRTPPSPE